MFKKKKRIAKTTTALAHAELLATVIDQIDREECSSDSLGAAGHLIMLELGFDETESIAALSQVGRKFGGQLPTLYWKEQTFVNKTSVLWSYIMTSIELLESGGVDDKYRRAASQAVEAVDRADGNKATPKKTFRLF